MASISITVPATVGTLGTAVSLASFQNGANLTIQLPATALVTDGATFYAGNVSNATSTAQLQPIPNLTIPTSGSTGQQPTIGTPVPYLYLYAVRTVVGTAGALVATVTGAEPDAGGAVPANAILQGGNAFGAEIDIGPTDGFALVIGAGGTFAASNCTALTLDTTTTGPISIGASAFGKAITIGNVTGATGITQNFGTGGYLVQGGAGGGAVRIFASANGSLSIDSGSTAGFVAIGSSNDIAKTILVGTGDTGVKTINIGTGTSANVIHIADSAGDHTVTIGAPAARTGSTRLNSGSGGIGIGIAPPGASGVAIDTPNAGAITIASATATAFTVGGGALAGATLNLGAAGTIAIGTAAVATTLNLGTGEAAYTTTLGSTNTTSTTAVRCGSGGLGLGVAAPGGSGVTLDTPAAGTILIGSANATTLTLGGAACATIGLGTAALATAITIGNVTTTTAVTVNTGTGGFAANATGAGNVRLTPGATGNVQFNGAASATCGVQLGIPVAVTDKNAGGSIGANTVTVDIASVIEVNQTTAGQTLTVPNPTVTTQARILYIVNIGSADFTLLASTVKAIGAGSKSMTALIWSPGATRWVPTVIT